MTTMKGKKIETPMPLTAINAASVQKPRIRPERRVALNSIRRSFDKNLESAELLFKVACVSAEREQGQDDDLSIKPGQARRISGLAFIVMSKAWEELVEACLVRYLMGATAPSGAAFKLKEATPAHSAKKAYELATQRGRVTGAENYLYCTDWKRVQACARQLLVDGKPFTALSDQQRSLLKRATDIRNRVAHDSAKCRTGFLAVAAEHGDKKGSRPRGYSVGHLLLKRTNQGFGKGIKKDRVFCHYAQNFKAMADVICPVPDGWYRHMSKE